MVREVLIASAVLMSTGALAAAPQRTMRGAAPPVTTTQTQAPQRTAPPPLPQTVAPPILLPMTPLTPLPAGGLTPPVPFTPTAILPTRDMFRVGRRDPFRNRPLPFPIVSGYGGYGGYGYTTEPQAYAAAAPSEAPVVMGGLRLTGTTPEAQVFLDGYFVGTLGDIESGRPLTVPAGPHRLEIRAAGYQPVTVDIQITPYETLTYRASLDRTPPPPRSSSASASSAMYLIPNCYLGNVPPRQNRLPSGCDIKRVQVLGNK